MAWTVRQRIERAIAKLIERETLDAENFFVIRRPKYYEKYEFVINVRPDASAWHRFDEVVDVVRDGLAQYDVHIVASKTLEVYVYGSDPNVLRWFLQLRDDISLGHIKLTDEAYHNHKLPKRKKNPGGFFANYRYRLRMLPHAWGVDPDNIDAFEQLELTSAKIVLRHWHSKSERDKINLPPEASIRDTFIYVGKLSEVLVLKLMFAGQIIEVVERD